ncbi:hypothetical protein [Brevundimonas sp. Root1279]|uniref:hypothetical protein n=1 Tax=Brevundimonas sp. Root1279 TaxID=1736443 RepID=UPI0006F6133F|nr:hypothetical protein [Brevundimonas sp. Root1279]KQW82260.1 hypothetical protein ASC65_08275 [Brevundimonas sp. Root1279]
MTNPPSIEIRLATGRVIGTVVLFAAIGVFFAVSGWLDWSSPEAFAAALARAETRRRTQMVELFSDRYVYIAVTVILTTIMFGLASVTAWLAVATRGPAMVLAGDRISRTVPWGHTVYRISPSAVLTPVKFGLGCEPPAVISASSGRAGKPGTLVPVIPLNWKLTNVSMEQMRRFLEQVR